MKHQASPSFSLDHGLTVLQAFHTVRSPLRDDRDEPRQLVPVDPLESQLHMDRGSKMIQAPCNDVLAGNLCTLAILEYCEEVNGSEKVEMH